MRIDNKIESLRKIVKDSDNIVFFGGAGVSTESNIPDFRSTDGLYSKKTKVDIPRRNAPILFCKTYQ